MNCSRLSCLLLRILLGGLLLVTTPLFQTCHPTQDLAPTDGLFSYQLVPQGDGLVTFRADSSQADAEFVWAFDDSTALVTTHSATTTHRFRRNASYLVNLTIKTSNQPRSDRKTITLASVLARTFEDLPPTKRDTLRLLYVLTDKSYLYSFNDPSRYTYDPYQSQLFINFMQRSLPNRHPKFAHLVFKHIIYRLSADDMDRFNRHEDPVGFLTDLMTTPTDPLYQELLAAKQKQAVTRLVFFLKDPLANGNPKYGYAGLAAIEGGFFLCLNAQPTLTAHELGHSFGFAHDTLPIVRFFR